MRACEQSSQLACWKHQGMDETYVGGLGGLLGHQAIYFWAFIVANHADRVDQGD